MSSNNNDLPLSTSDITQEVQIRQLSAAGEQAAIPPTTVMANFDKIVQSMGDKPALHQKVSASVRIIDRKSLVAGY
jgi:hypothetical protein